MLTPEQRVLRARLAAYTRWSTVSDRAAATAAGQAASPASLTWFERQVDPDGVLPAKTRRLRAEAARSAYFTRLAFRSSRARSARKEQQ